MSQIKNLFMDSFLKSLKRPELYNFDADESYGANLLHGSENQNPWANRNAENAKYGQLGGTQPIKAVYGQAQGGGSFANMPGMTGSSPAQGTFNNLMAGARAPGQMLGSEYLAKPAWEGIKRLFSPGEGTIGETYKAIGKDFIADKLPLSTAEQSLSDIITGANTPSAMERVGSDFLSNIPKPSEYVTPGTAEASATNFDPTSLGVSMLGPVVGAISGSKLAGDATSAAAMTGLAAAQGGLNPLSDIAALYALIRFGGGLF